MISLAENINWIGRDKNGRRLVIQARHDTSLDRKIMWKYREVGEFKMGKKASRVDSNVLFMQFDEKQYH